MRNMLFLAAMAGAWSCQASPLLTFSAGGTGATSLTSTAGFAITIDATGAGTIALTNNIGQLITDFHFVSAAAQTDPLTGAGATFFSSIPTGTTSTLDFFQGLSGTGIANGTTFTIALSGFNPATPHVNANASIASTVPEPTSTLLLGIGLAAIAAVGLRRPTHVQS